MKHSWSTTLLLLFLFVCAQLVGLSLLVLAIDHIEQTPDGPVVSYETTAIGERPDFTGHQSFLYLFFGIAVGTVLLLIIARFGKTGLWKVWFALAVYLALSVAFGVVLPPWLALLLAAGLALWKVYKPNPLVHNVTEVFLYAGIAVLLAPIFDVFWMVIVLLAISVYDMIAVWKTKHMVSLAEFQKKGGVFAGLMLSKPANGKIVKLPPPPNAKAKGAAILGGGDVAFPLLFSGTVLRSLIENGYTPLSSFAVVQLITLFVTVALFMLFFYAKKDRYYPAMPFVSLGCFVGYGVVLLFV